MEQSSISYAAVAPSIWRLDDNVLLINRCVTKLTLHILHCKARNNLSFYFTRHPLHKWEFQDNHSQ